MKKLFFLILADACSHKAITAPIDYAPEEYVNVLAGTHGSEAAQKARSTGNTLPLVARPWGFNHWAPQTTNRETSWWFDADSDEFHGIRCTHQPSPWIGDWGWFVLLPGGDQLKNFLGFTSYHPAGVIRPYLMDILGGPHGVRIELTPTMHGAFMRVTFAASVPKEARRVCGAVPRHDGNHEEKRAAAAHVNTGECKLHDTGFSLQSRRYAFGVPDGETGNFSLFAYVESIGTRGSIDSDKRMCCLELQDGKTQIELRLGTSLISAEQAALALRRELSRNHSFEDVVMESRMAWRSTLKRVHVVDPGPPSALTHQRLEIFYTALYRALLFPRRLDEHTEKGVYHWSPYDAKVHKGPGVADNGFWDTFRTVYPLLTLAYPTELGEILEGWVNAFRAGGWIPQWSSPGYRGSMCGTYGEVVLADAILKNITGFNHTTAWEALRKESFEAFPNPRDTTRGKHAFNQYLQYGYIPANGVENACTETLDLAHADAAVALVAERLGYATDAEILKQRSKRALTSLYNPEARLMQGKDRNNKFLGHSVPNKWGDCWAEGSPWHHSFPPFNMTALVELYGGRDKLLERLRELFSAPADYQYGGYKKEIHEMLEMKSLAMGQYAHNNQPAHHLPYMFALLGEVNETGQVVRKILAHAYSTDGYSGDEDNGEMGAWFVLSALGLYATAVGTSEDYVLGAVPLFPRVHLQDLDIVIEAPSASKKSPSLLEVRWGSRNSRKLTTPTISYAALRQGGVLRFVSPENSRLGSLVSSLRGTAHHVAKKVKTSKVGSMVSDRASSSPWVIILFISASCFCLCTFCCGDSKALHKD